jgi:hypothetical protein
MAPRIPNPGTKWLRVSENAVDSQKCIRCMFLCSKSDAITSNIFTTITTAKLINHHNTVLHRQCVCSVSALVRIGIVILAEARQHSGSPLPQPAS